jgi:hypothetical protein
MTNKKSITLYVLSILIGTLGAIGLVYLIQPSKKVHCTVSKKDFIVPGSKQVSFEYNYYGGCN